MKQATAYICDHCGTISLHAPYIKGHEKQCYMNPVNRACKSCAYWFKNHKEYANPDDPNRDFQREPLPFCDHTEADYSLEKEWVDYHGYYETNAIRKDCPGYKQATKKERAKRTPKKIVVKS